MLLSVDNMLISICLVAHFCLLGHEIYGKNAVKGTQVYTVFAVLKQDSEVLPRQSPQILRVTSA